MRLFFLTPYKARGLIEQAKGRIERICEGKTDAVVYDYIDDIRMFQNQFELRLELYRDHNLVLIK